MTVAKKQEENVSFAERMKIARMKKKKNVIKTKKKERV